MKIKEFLHWLGRILHKTGNLDHIKEISLFSRLNFFQLYQLNNYMHIRNYKSGEIIFEQGYPLDAIFFIKCGEVQVSNKLNASEPIILKKGDFIGIIDMFHEGIRSNSAFATTDVTALAISKSDLGDLIECDKDMGFEILSAICRYLSSLYFESVV